MLESEVGVTAKLIRTVIVDDSAFVRKIVREILSGSPFIEVVGVARNGQEALSMVEELKPDVVTCDLLMTGMDGVEFVKEQMKRSPLPILILTASPEDGKLVLDALDAGAVDLVKKPTALATDQLLIIRRELVEKVKASARAPVAKLRVAAAPAKGAIHVQKAAKADIVVIGLSTGGPQALRYLLPQFAADFPVPIVIVLHMPAGYTALFAEALNALAPMNVKEVQDGDLIEPGRIGLAQAGSHLLFKRTSTGTVAAKLALTPSSKPHRPSVDVLFESAAQTYRSRVLGVIMTGMGDDGMRGAACVKAQGGTILTEAEESCVIYGMPKVVVESGLSDGSYSLEAMAEAITNHL